MNANPRSRRVLLVEDDADAQFIYVSCLRHAGFDVEATGSVREAAAAAKRAPHEIVVLDRRLPDGDGLELAREWRASAGPMSSAPIIVLSAFATRPDVEAALRAGCDAFLPKPCPGDILAAHVMKLLISNAPTRQLSKAGKFEA